MSDRSDMSAIVQQIRTSRRPIILERVQILQRAADAARAGGLSAELRDLALQEAHRLKGLLGSLGFPEGSDAAGQIERTLANSASATDTDIDALVAIINQF